jgi:hypothetical protein
MSDTRLPEGHFCSFCGKSRAEVQRLVSGPVDLVAICDECISLSMQIIADLKPRPEQSDNGPYEPGNEPKYLGTVRDWSVYSTDELVRRFRLEDEHEREASAWRSDRYRAMFMTLRGRDLSLAEIWKILRIVLKWGDFPDLSEVNAARHALERIVKSDENGDSTTKEELLCAASKLISAKKELIMKFSRPSSPDNQKQSTPMNINISIGKGGSLTWNGEPITIAEFSSRAGKMGSPPADKPLGD